MKAQFAALRTAKTASGASVRSIFYNDPRTWTNANGEGGLVRFAAGRGGSYQVNVAPPKPALSASQKAALKTGAAAVATKGGAAANSDKATKPLPGVHSSPVTIANELKFGELLQQWFVGPLTDYLDSADEATGEGLAAYLQARGFGAGASTAVTSFDVSADRLQLGIDFSALRTVSKHLDLGGQARALGLNLDSDVLVDFTVEANFRFTLGVDLTQTESPADAIYLHVDELRFDAHVDGEVPEFKVNVGFLGAGVEDATLDLNASLDVHFNHSIHDENNPTGSDEESEVPTFTPDQILTLSELESASLDDLISVTAWGTLDTVLPLRTSLGSFSFGALTPTVTLHLDDVFSGQSPEVTFNSDFDQLDLKKFFNVNSTDVGGLLGQIGDWLKDLGDASPFATALPFAKGIDVGSALNVGGAWRERVTSLLSNNGASTFSNAQELLDVLKTVFPNANYANGAITFDIDLQHTLAPVEAPIDFNLDLSPLADVSASSKVQVGADVGARFTFGIDLSPVGGGFTVLPGDVLTPPPRGPAG